MNKDIEALRANAWVQNLEERERILETLVRDLFADLDNAIHSCPRKRTLMEYEKIMRDMGIEVNQ